MKRYHMRRSDREITDIDELLRVLKNGKYTVVGLCRNDEPYVVTLSYGYDEDKHALYFHCATEGLKLEFIKANSNACATVIEDLGYATGKCSHKYCSVVLFGEITIVEDINEKKHALHVMIEHLEDNPDEVKINQLRDDEVYKKIAVLRLDIKHMTGKLSK